MKTKYFVILLVAVMLTGCTSQAKTLVSNKETDSRYSSASTKVYYMVDDTFSTHPNHYYNLLNEDEKLVYDLVSNSLLNIEDSLTLYTDADTLLKCYQYVVNDYPEIFYCDGYTYEKHSDRLVFRPHYSMSADDIADYRLRISSKVQECLRGISSTSDDYEKVKYVYEWIIDNTEYVPDSENNQNICSVFLSGKSVCQGYAKATQLMLNELGVYATLVTGTSADSEAHAWDLVKLDDSWYYVDTTNGDTTYTGANGNSVILYDYLCIPTGEAYDKYSPDDKTVVPISYDTQYNYYVQEGCYFSLMSRSKIDNIFKDADECVTLKASTQGVYEELYDYLITDKRIFNYVTDASVQFFCNEEERTLTFMWS